MLPNDGQCRWGAAHRLSNQPACMRNQRWCFFSQATPTGAFHPSTGIVLEKSGGRGLGADTLKLIYYIWWLGCSFIDSQFQQGWVSPIRSGYPKSTEVPGLFCTIALGAVLFDFLGSHAPKWCCWFGLAGSLAWLVLSNLFIRRKANFTSLYPPPL